MAGLDDNVGLVGRETTAELIDHLVRHVRDRPMPIVVLHGAGGVGKTAVIEHVERRYDKAVPMARVDFDEPRSKSTWDVLEAVYRQLGAESHREFGRLVLPRYELARTVHATLRHPEHSPAAEDEAEAAPGEPLEVATSAQRRRQVREQLARRLASVELMTDVVGEAGDSAPAPVAGLLLRMARPILHRLTAIGVGAPRWARWLLAGPRSAAALSWFETAAAEPQHFEGISDRIRIDDVVLHIQGRFESTDARASDAADKWHRLALAALLADLRAAYLRRRTRTVNCVLLLDDADLLSPDKAERVALSTPPTEPGGDPDFLDLLAEAMKADPRVPLLVVATKQSGAGAGAAEEPGPPGTDPGRQWRKRYDEWAEQFRGDGPRTPELATRLTNFGLEDTRRFFIERSRSEEATVLSERYVRELHCATHGHPLALTLVSDRIDWSFRRDRRVPSARSTMGMRVPPGLRGADLEDTVRGYLLMRMLHRFRTNAPSEDEDDHGGVRDRTVTLFAKLAAPLRLDEPVVRLLAGDRGAAGVRQITEALDILSFVRPGRAEPDGNRTWTLDPLLRDLLVRELLDRPDHAYEQVHRDLAEHYESIERHDSAAYLRAQYHRLALGEVSRVAKVLSTRADSGDVSWQRDLVRVLAWAPVVVFRRPYQMRELVQRAWSPGARSESVEAIADLLRAVQALCSCTVVDAWDDKAFAQVAHAQREAPGTAGVDLGKWNPAFARLRPLNSQDERGVPDSSAANRKFGYPVVWPRRGTIPRVTAFALVLALVGYGFAFVVHSTWDCDEDRDPLDVTGIARTALSDPLRLTKVGTQCIGVTDRSSSFTAAAEEPSAATREIAALTAEGVAENNRVAREEEPHRRPLVKIVVATMLSSIQDGERRELAVGVNELRGAVLAQREWNEGKLVAKHTPDVKVQLLFANLGGSSQHAVDVARAVRSLAKRDPSIAAVTGLGQSRDTTVDAVDLLGAPPDDAGAPVPMIASAASGTTLTGKPWFFRIAATNRRQAEVAVRFGIERFPEHTVNMLTDDGDAYSEDLSKWQLNELVSRTRWPVVKRYTPSSDSLSSKIGEICEQDRPLIYYSGRANDFPVMLDELKRRDCAERAVVIAGDDLTQFANGEWEDARSVPGGYPPERLFFTSLGPSVPAPDGAGWADALCAAPDPIRGHARCGFFAGYERFAAETVSDIAGTGPNGHVLVAYDAVHLASRAAERVRGTEDTAPPSRSGVLEQLRGTGGSEAFAGTSGLIDFGMPAPGRGGADPQRKLIVIQRINIAGDDVAGAEVVEHDGQL